MSCPRGRPAPPPWLSPCANQGLLPGARPAGWEPLPCLPLGADDEFEMRGRLSTCRQHYHSASSRGRSSQARQHPGGCCSKQTRQGEDLGTPGPCRASLWWVRAEPQEGSTRACTPPQQASGVWGEREQRNISSCIFCLTRCFTIGVLSSLT